ncbi:MAG: MerR family transcriptional regulator [Clostridia bacterium]|nr:MerR family transcriptional regulator [Clostridia bacterium]
MLKIGEFAKICNVSTQTLRYYDTEKILCADAVDQYSGYRYYHPDKIQVYQKIVALKDMGFSLEEIKEILYAPEEKQSAACVSKKRELNEQIRHLSLCIAKLENMQEQKGGILPPLQRKLSELPFENDPEVVGLWELCGEITGTDMEQVGLMPLENLKEPHCKTFPKLYFLPGGAMYYLFSWSKGVLYRHAAYYNTVIPNEYRLFWQDDTRYMCIRWIGQECIDNGEDATLLLYRQVDRREYTEMETHAFVDDVDIPFVPDEDIVGVWDVVDLVRDAHSFSPEHPQVHKGKLYASQIQFMNRGYCYRTWLYKKPLTQNLFYTKGLILNVERRVAEKYVLKELEGERYLIVEHKSGDYEFMGKVFCYYVYKKRNE